MQCNETANGNQFCAVLPIFNVPPFGGKALRSGGRAGVVQLIIYYMNRKNITVALLAAVLIGSLMNLVNNYDVFTGGKFTGRNIFKIMLTYIIPFCVSLYSSVKAAKQKV